MPYIWESSPRECENARCGKTFTPMRSDAKYCSGKCRTAHHRQQGELHKKITKLDMELWRLYKGHRKNSMNDEDVATVRRLAKVLLALADEGEEKRLERQAQRTQ
jgi:methionyl-tRNA synthetase